MTICFKRDVAGGITLLERRQATLQANEEKFRSQFRRFVDADAANQFEGSTFRKLCARRIET